jgi:hypothetical protein
MREDANVVGNLVSEVVRREATISEAAGMLLASEMCSQLMTTDVAALDAGPALFVQGAHVAPSLHGEGGRVGYLQRPPHCLQQGHAIDSGVGSDVGEVLSRGVVMGQVEEHSVASTQLPCHMVDGADQAGARRLVGDVARGDEDAVPLVAPTEDIGKSSITGALCHCRWTLCVCVCMYVCVCVYVCIYVYMCIHVSMCVCLYVCRCMYL